MTSKNQKTSGEAEKSPFGGYLLTIIDKLLKRISKILKFYFVHVFHLGIFTMLTKKNPN